MPELQTELVLPRCLVKLLIRPQPFGFLPTREVPWTGDVGSGGRVGRSGAFRFPVRAGPPLNVQCCEVALKSFCILKRGSQVLVALPRRSARGSRGYRTGLASLILCLFGC